MSGDELIFSSVPCHKDAELKRKAQLKALEILIAIFSSDGLEGSDEDVRVPLDGLPQEELTNAGVALAAGAFDLYFGGDAKRIVSFLEGLVREMSNSKAEEQ